MIVATKEMCFLACEALQNAVREENSQKVKSVVEIPNDDRHSALFVTYLSNNRLRGCIGCFQPLPLWVGIQTYAVIAGIQDWRFGPIKEEEFETLTVSVSLLHSFEDCKDLYDWEVGVHGVIMALDDNTSTYLPEVPPLNSWTKDDTLRHLAKKGGFTGEYDEEAKGRSMMARYKSSKCVVSWKEYQEYLKTLE